MAFVPLHNGPRQYFDINGDPMSGGTLEFYRAGTTTATNLYSDTGGTSIGSSITLNARGYPEAGGNVIMLFYDESVSLKLVLKNADGATIWTADNISASGSFDSDSNDKLTGIEAGADVTDAENVGAVVNGRQSMWIPANLMSPDASAGCAALATTEITAGRPNTTALAFDSSVIEYAHFAVAFPKRWDKGTVTFQPYFTHAGGNTAGLDGVAWGLSAVACALDDTIDTPFGTAQLTGRDGCDTAGDLYTAAESAAVTIAGSPQDGELVFFRIYRDVASSSPLDDLDADALLLGVKLFWTSNALNDV